jgi:hypothetical protein
MRHVYLCVSAALALAMFAFAAESRANPAPAAVPRLDAQNVIADDIQSEALAAYRRHAAQGAFRGNELVIVDYRKPSDAPRLYILNIATGAVEAYYVAHGRGSDPGHTQRAIRLSDAPTTGMSSVGAFRGLERYQSPENGPALRLAGLDWTNANAYDRLIVFHTAGYFDPAARRFGRSCGCFVVTRQAMERVYGVLADGGFLYAGPARLHDKTASTARDCNPHCGGNCNAPLIASAKPPARRAVAVAKAEPAPPIPAAKPAPVPLTPALAVAKVDLAPVSPRPKPALPPDAPGAELAFVPTPHAKPSIEAAGTAVAETALAPVPLAKPELAPALDVAQASLGAPLVPNPLPGEIPVPVGKPAGLKQVAELLQ